MNPNPNRETPATRLDPGVADAGAHVRGADTLERYAGGFLEARHGKVNAWLVVVIVGLVLWALYYGFTYWGGLGIGLDY